MHTARLLTFVLAFLPIVINALPAPADELAVRGECLYDYTHCALTYYNILFQQLLVTWP